MAFANLIVLFLVLLLFLSAFCTRGDAEEDGGTFGCNSTALRRIPDLNPAGEGVRNLCESGEVASLFLPEK